MGSSTADRFGAGLPDAAARRLAAAVLEATVEGVLVVDPAGVVVTANPAAHAMFGYAGGDLVGRPVGALVPEGHRERHAEHLATFTGDDPRIMGRGRDLAGRRADGSSFPLEVTLTPLTGTGAGAGSDAGPRYVCATVRDITERVELDRRLTYLSMHDLLTGLGNRARLEDRLGQAAARRRRHGGLLAVLLLDLDRFKAVNDSLGHAAGDDLLREVAARMLACVRPEDSVVRLGGDEFVVLCEVGSPDQALLVAERVQDRLAVPVRLGPVEVYVGASVGVALADGTEEDVDPDRLLGEADLALYAAKAEGRGRVRLFDPSMRAAAEGRLSLAGDLHRAAERGEISARFAPLVHLGTGEVVGVRARTHWQHPRVGPVAAADVRALAEDTELVVTLDRLTLVAACRAVEPACSRSGAPLAVWVPLATRSLASPGLLETLLAALADAGLPPDRLVVEVAESTVGLGLPPVRQALVALRAAGVGVAVQDLGGGRASLADLLQVPATAVEVSHGLVGTADRAAPARAVVDAVVAVAGRLGLVAVADGVATPDQRAALTSAGCTLATGPLWGEDVPVDRLADLLPR